MEAELSTSSQGTLHPPHRVRETPWELKSTEVSEAGTRVVSKDNKTLSVPPGAAGNLIIQFSVVTNKVMRLGTRNLEVNRASTVTGSRLERKNRSAEADTILISLAPRSGAIKGIKRYSGSHN